MNNKITTLILMAAMAGATSTSWADNVNATGNNNDPMSHPVNAYNNHEVKEDMKDSQVNGQKAAEAKAEYDQAKTDYDKSLKANGPKSATTIEAKKRMHEAREDMHKYNKKTAKANKSLREDETKAHQ